MTSISGPGGAQPSWQNAQAGQSRKTEHEARMFAKVDSDGSGRVDATELASMLAHTGQSGDSAELLKKMDGDGDGSLSQDELSQGLRDLMPPPSSTLAFAQQRGAANDSDGGDDFASLDSDGDGALTRAEFEAGRPAPPPGGMPPPQGAGGAGGASSASSAMSGTRSTSTDYDPLDINQDGTVSEIERLAGQLKELAAAGSDSSAQQSSKSEIAMLAQKLYNQIARNWLQSSATTATQVSTTA